MPRGEATDTKPTVLIAARNSNDGDRPTTILRRPQRRGVGHWALFVVGAIAVLAVGALAAIAVSRGGTSSSTSKTEIRTLATTVTQQTPAQASVVTTTSGSSAEPEFNPALTTFEGRLYTAQVPADWIREKSDEPISGRLESQWRDPNDDNTSVLIDAQSPDLTRNGARKRGGSSRADQQ